MASPFFLFFVWYEVKCVATSEKMQERMVDCTVLFGINLWLNSIYGAMHVIVFELRS